MTKTRILIFMLAVFAGGPTLAAASGGTPEDDLPASFNEPVTMSLKDAPLANVVRTMEKIAGIPVDLDSALADRRLTVELQNNKLKTSLTVICERIGCNWRVVNSRLQITPAPPTRTETRERLPNLDTPVTLDLKDAELGAVLKLCAQTIGVPIRLHGDAKTATRLVSVHLVGSSTRESLDAVCKDLCHWTLVAEQPDAYLSVEFLPSAAAGPK